MKDTILTVLLFAAAATAWYFVYIKPADEARAAIIDCMADRGDLHSRAAYDACVVALRGDK